MGDGGCSIIGRMSNSDTTPLVEPNPAPKRRINLVWIFLGVLLLIVVAGSVGGYISGQALHAERVQADVHTFDVEQFQLAGEDFIAGNYRRAAERLDAILNNEPDFPDAAQLREQALLAIDATPTPLPTETPVPSPTPDAPRAEQLLAQAKQQFTDKDYPEMIKTLLTLKVELTGYQPERVDGLLWVALRFNGVHLIKDTNRLTEGMYFLDLAANYAPLDQEAMDQLATARNFLAVYQSAYYFLNKDIEVSLGYFRDAVAIRPYYTDRLIRDYVDIVVQNADALVNQNACGAWTLYEEALGKIPDYEPALKGRDYAKENCDESEPVPIQTAEPTLEPTPES